MASVAFDLKNYNLMSIKTKVVISVVKYEELPYHDLYQVKLCKL